MFIILLQIPFALDNLLTGLFWYLFNNPKVKDSQGMLDVVLCSLNA